MGWTVDEIIKFATLLMPLIDQVIKWIEKLFAKKPGALKKAKAAMVLNTILPEGVLKGPEADSLIGNLIDSRVAMMNEAGVFKHAAKVKK